MFLSKVMSLWGYLQVSLFLLACFCCAYFFITGEVIQKLFSEIAFFFFFLSYVFLSFAF